MSFDTELDPDDISTNPTPGPCFNDIIERRATRRTVLATGGATAAATFLTTALPGGPAAAHGGTGRRRRHLLGFEPVPLSTADEVVVPVGYTARPFIPWGTPLTGSLPAFVPGTPPFVPAGNTAADQEQQVGMHHDGMHFFARDERPPRPPPRPSTHRPRPARGQPRVHRRGLPAHRHQHAAGQDVLDRRHGPQVPGRPRRLGGGDRGGVARFLVRRPPVAAEPADHHQHADVLLRPRGRPPAGPHLGRPGRPRPGGHPQQLLARRDPVGHLPRVRGELQRLLPRRPRRLHGRAAGAPEPVRRRRGPQQLGHPRRPLRRHRRGSQRAQPVRLGRRDRPLRPGLPPGQAHRARAGSSTRAPSCTPPRAAASSSTPATTR